MTTLNPLKFYLNVLKPTSVFTGRVNGSPSDPFMSITWDGGATGTVSSVATSGAPVPGNSVWFGTSEGGKERGTVRLRSWTPSGSPAAGTLSIAETDDVGPNIADDDFITVKLDFRMWPIYPRPVLSGLSVIYYEDYDLTWAGENQPTQYWRPHAVAGPPEVTFLDGGVATGSFVGDRSFTLTPSATISSYLWTAHGSNEGTSTAQGTIASPVRFTWNTEGQHLVSLQVTDSNGRTHTQFTWAFVIEPDGTQIAYADLDSVSDNMDFGQGGGDSSFTVHGNADVGQFPEGSLVAYAAKGTMTDSALGSWPYRDNLLFLGYIVSNSITQSPDDNSVTFKAASINTVAGNTSIFPITLTDSNSPSTWVEAENITVDRVCSFVSQWRSTLSRIAPIRPLNYVAQIYRQDLGTSSVWGEMGNVLNDAWAKAVVNHQGVVHWERDYQMMTTGSERAATPAGRNLTNEDWVGEISIDERSTFARSTAKIQMSGVYYPENLATVEPYFSEAPGDVPKSFGRYESQDALILTTQADLNARCGLALAKGNMKYPVVRAKFFNNAGFTNAPQTRYTATIRAEDNSRGLEWEPTLIPRRIRRSYDHRGGFFTVDVEFEPDASGPPGVTVTMPSTPPVPSGGSTPSVPTGTAVDLLSAGSIYLLFGASWEAQVTGTTTYWAEGDPWLSNASIYRSELGNLYKSTDYGQVWANVNPSSAPPSGTASLGNITFMDIQPSTTEQDKFLIAGKYLNASGTWESYIGYTTGGGDAWGWW